MKIPNGFLYPDDFENGFDALEEGAAEKDADLIISVVKKLTEYPMYLLLEQNNIDIDDIQTANDCRFLLRGDYGQYTHIVEPSARSLALGYELIENTELLLETGEISECVSDFREAFQKMLSSINHSLAWEAVNKEKKLIQAMPHIVRGEKVLAGAKSAHEETHGTAEQKKQRWQQYQDECIELKENNSYLGITEIRRKIAKKNGVSYKTVLRHTVGLNLTKNSRNDPE